MEDKKKLRHPCPDKDSCRHVRDLRRKYLDTRREMQSFRDKLLVEINRRESAEEQLLTDPLTGAFNRRGLEKRFLEECSKAQRHKRQKLFMLFIDIDDFKRFNDEHGENTGDLVLKEVVSTIETNKRPYDSVFRIGGEEFLVLMPGIKALGSACRAAERIRKKVARLKISPHDNGKKLSITISVGIARLGSADSLDTLIDKANEAELEAKNTGKNRTYLYLGGEVLPVEGLIKPRNKKKKTK